MLSTSRPAPQENWEPDSIETTPVHDLRKLLERAIESGGPLSKFTSMHMDKWESGFTEYVIHLPNKTIRVQERMILEEIAKIANRREEERERKEREEKERKESARQRAVAFYGLTTIKQGLQATSSQPAKTSNYSSSPSAQPRSKSKTKSKSLLCALSKAFGTIMRVSMRLTFRLVGLCLWIWAAAFLSSGNPAGFRPLWRARIVASVAVSISALLSLLSFVSW